jgi:hypothetical protein
MTTRREQANAEAHRRLCAADPVLIDILPALDAVPGFEPTTILTSGPPMGWASYEGGQRNAVIGGALFEGLAGSVDDAEEKIAAG